MSARQTSLGLLLAASSLLAAACTQPAEDATGAQSAEQNERTGAPVKLEAIPGGEWARCWVEATNGAAGGQSVLCSSTIAEGDPLSIGKITMTLRSGERAIASKLLVNGGRANAAPQGAAALPTQFPLTVEIAVTPNYGKTNMGISAENDTLTASVTISSAAGATKEHPIVFAQPFAVWPIAIVERVRNADDVFAYVPAPYDVPSAPFVTAGVPATVLRVKADTDTLPVADRQHVIRASLVAPPSGGIAVGVTLNLGPGGLADLKQRATIDGPGIYIAEPTGLRKATPSDALPPELVQSAAPAPSAPAAAPSPANVCDEGRRPATDPDPTPCGGDGQRCCNPIPACSNSGTCKPGFECMISTCM
jgi:hypothetical protein